MLYLFPVMAPDVSRGEVTRPTIYEFKDEDSSDCVPWPVGFDPNLPDGLLNRYEEEIRYQKISNLNLMSKETMEMEVRDGMLSIRAASTRLSNPIANDGATELNG